MSLHVMRRNVRRYALGEFTSTSPAFLLNSLQAYWKMDEGFTGATRLDSSGNGLHLTDQNGNLSPVSGKIGNSVACTQTSSSNCLTHASNAAFNTGPGISFSFSAWVQNQGFVSGAHGIICYDNNTAAGSYDLYSDGTNVFWFVLDSTITAKTITIVSAAAMGTGTFHHFAFGYDDANKLMWSQYDGGARVTLAVSNGINPATTLAFCIGNFSAKTLPQQCNVDEVGYWRRVLTTTDVAKLYNGGSGLPFSSFV